MKKLIFFFLSVVAFCKSTLHSQNLYRPKIIITTKENDKQIVKGAKVYIDGSYSGTIPDTFPIRAKPRFIVITKPDYIPIKIDMNEFDMVDEKASYNRRFEFKFFKDNNPNDLIDYYEMTVTLKKEATPEDIIAPVNAIDIIDSNDIKTEYRLCKQITALTPSFNTTQQPISDASAHFDMTDFRGLGSSRMLVLVNNKRRHLSANTYLTDAYSKGDVNVDLEGIPLAAIDKIEILRDGASVRYGSDAIAGVLNIRLKNQFNISSGNAFGGTTLHGDGQYWGYHVTKLIEANKGYLQVTHSFFNQQETNRVKSTKAAIDSLLFFDENGKIAAGISKNDSNWVKKHPDLGMRVGLPNSLNATIVFNGGMLLDETNELYSFGNLSYRQGSSYAFYRTPYFPTLDLARHKLYFFQDSTQYDGFQPTFNVDILDRQWTVGIRNKKNYDISYGYGANEVDYTVGESINTSMGYLSPKSFKVGGYGFSHHLINMNFNDTWEIDKWLLERIRFYAGTEMRVETFTEKSGEKASYTNYLTEPDSARYKKANGFESSLGTISFPGIQPQNAIEVMRYNVGIYANAELNFRIPLVMVIGGRYEKYSDYSKEAPNGNIGFKYKMGKIYLRTSASTNFRAPALHQIYLSTIQTINSTGKLENQGTFNNNSAIIRQLGIEKLKAERAINYTVGIFGRFGEEEHKHGFYGSIDAYQIDLKDRIVYSSSIEDPTKKTDIYKVLQDYNIKSLKFFVNAVATQTRGVDVAFHYIWKINDVRAFKVDLVGNRTWHQIKNFDQDSMIPPPSDIFKKSNISIFDKEEQARILTYRPKIKAIANLAYKTERWDLNLRGTYYGKVEWEGKKGDKNQILNPKIVLDGMIAYNFSGLGKLNTIYLTWDNIFAIYPDESNASEATFHGRFLYPWAVQQFTTNGSVIGANLKVRF